MKSWLLSIVGVVFLGVLFDLLYPNGRTNTLCKSIFGIFAVFVMIGPIFNFDFENINTITNNDVLIHNINEAKSEALEQKIEAQLLENGISGVIVEIESKLDYNDFVIENIFIDVSNLVLTENLTNINKCEVIIDQVINIVDIEKERIVVYG